MPAKSKSQQRLFGMLHAYNKGEFKGNKQLKKKLRDMSKRISDEDAVHFAETQHKGLPEKKAYTMKQIVNIQGNVRAAALEKLAQEYYTVTRGDTPYSIAKMFNVQPNLVMSAIGITDPRKLRVGTRIPLSAFRTPARQATPSVRSKPATPTPTTPATTRQNSTPTANHPTNATQPVSGPIVPAQEHTRFVKDIIFPMKRRYAGNDYNHTGYTNDFIDKLRYSLVDSLPGTTLGRHNSAGNKITVVRGNEGAAKSVGPHEVAHAQQTPAGSEVGSGMSSRDRRILTRAYGFTPEMVAKPGETATPLKALQEAHSTNREYQYRLYREISDQLKRPATFEEFHNYVQSLPAREIQRKFFFKSPNGYTENKINSIARPPTKEESKSFDAGEKFFERARPKIDAEALRQAWSEVAKNNSGVPNNIA